MKGLKQLNLGVEIQPNFKLVILLFADGIVLKTQSEISLQSMLDYLAHWCNKNKMEVNINKTEEVHFRKNNQDRTQFKFCLGNCNIWICENYRYLGVVQNDYLDFIKTSNVLSESAGRAFSSLKYCRINKKREKSTLSASVYVIFS